VRTYKPSRRRFYSREIAFKFAQLRNGEALFIDDIKLFQAYRHLAIKLRKIDPTFVEHTEKLEPSGWLIFKTTNPTKLK